MNGGGGAGKFRVKIWEAGDDSIIYNNLIGSADDACPTTTIQSGSIDVHREEKK